MKQSAARTGVEQAADGTRVFPNMNALASKTTVQHIAPGQLPLKRSIKTALEKLHKSKELNIPMSKIRALIDYIAGLPQMMAQACTVSGIQVGFKNNGMLDENCMKYADWRKLIGTCKRNITNEDSLRT